MPVRRFVSAACLFVLPIAVAATAAAQTTPKASFDCAQARNAVEKAICAEEWLGELDIVLDEVYRAVLASSEQEIRQNVDKRQKAFLARRDRCGAKAKPDGNCIARLYKAQIVDLVNTWRAFGNGTGARISGNYEFRLKGFGGQMFLAELPDARTFVQIETVNTGIPSPHICNFTARVKDRRGDLLDHRDPAASKTCALQIEVKGKVATLRESPKDCYDLVQYWCGARATMAGTYVKR